MTEGIIDILKGHEAGAETMELCSRHGISRQNFYRWKHKSGGFSLKS